MDRRTFLSAGVMGTVGIALEPLLFEGAVAQGASQKLIKLTIRDVMNEMSDETLVPMWSFVDSVAGPCIPGPMIFVEEGSRVDIYVENQLDEDHSFFIDGVIDSGVIRPGRGKRLKFRAPIGGSYIYQDHLNAPVNRVMGLHGVLISMPKRGNTPYSNPTPNIQKLFNDLGNSDHFPGEPWNNKPGNFTQGSRTWIWVFSCIDSSKSNAVSNLSPGQIMSPSQFLNGFLPDYFTLNGKNGFFSAEDPDIAPSGFVGQPALLRLLNVGLLDHSPHVHGNHIYMLRENGLVHNNVIFLDTFILRPLDCKDVLLPFMQPPDIPIEAWPPVEEKFPLRYPMHDHNEISQTAAGGNYPHGLVTHWNITGPLQT